MARQEYETKQLIDELAKMPPMVIATAHLYAINYTRYGEDVTEKWVTALQNSSALEKAYNEGYYDALQKQPVEEKTGEWIYNSPVTMKCNQCAYVASDWKVHEFHFCPNCGVRMLPKKNDPLTGCIPFPIYDTIEYGG